MSAASKPLVIKLGGEVVGGSALAIVAADIAALAAEMPVVIVHGGGPQATALSKQLGLETKQIGGRRVTDERTLDVMKMVVAGKLNVDLCAALVAHGARPVGLSGASSLLIAAERRPPKRYPGAGDEPVDLGLVGDVTGVNRALISLLLDAGHTPVLACLGADARGQVYNINADTVASRIAVALDARGLVLVSDVPGVLRDVHDPASRIGRLSVAEGRALIAEGVATKGMIPKLEEAFDALAEGVARIHIVGRLSTNDLLREAKEPGSCGTVLVP